MKKQLQIIANTVYINTQEVDNTGLLNGQTGIVLFLYHYYRYCGNEIYKNMADDLLEEIFSTISQNNATDFENGLTGIGWAIQHLIENNFVEGDPDEVLEDVDNIILNDLKRQASNPDFIRDINFINHSLYFLSRAKNRYSEKKFAEVFSNVLNFLNLAFDNKNDKLQLDILNSLLFFLLKIREEKIYRKQCGIVLAKLAHVVENAISHNNYNDADLAILSKFLKKYQMGQATQWNRIHKIVSALLIKKTETTENFIKNAWLNCLYFEMKEDIEFDINISEAINEIILNLRKDNLVINNGLVGIGLGLLEKENAKENIKVE